MDTTNFGDFVFFSILLTFSAFCYFKIAKKYNIIDKPNHRSSHNKPTVRGGGIVFLFGLLIFFFSNNFIYPYFVVGTLIVALISFIDDLKTISPKIRSLFQVISILFIFYEIGTESFPIWSYLPVLILAVGFVNFFNFMDGINGITGLSALTVLGTFYYLNLYFQVVENSLLIIMIISVLIFGYFNFRAKALMFAGDIGSISMALVLLYIGLELILRTQSPLIMSLYMIYGADSTLTVFYRIYTKENISKPHRLHIYQKLVDNFGFSHIKVSFFYAIAQMILSVISIYFLLNIDLKYHYVILLFFSLVITILYFTIFYINEKRINSN